VAEVIEEGERPGWCKLFITQVVFLEKSHEVQQVVNVGSESVWGAVTAAQIAQERGDYRDGLISIIQQEKRNTLIRIRLDA